MVVGGRYFIQISQSDDSSYIEFEYYKWKKEAIHFSHLVVATKLKLTEFTIEASSSTFPPHHHYHLEIHNRERIIKVIIAKEGVY